MMRMRAPSIVLAMLACQAALAAPVPANAALGAPAGPTWLVGIGDRVPVPLQVTPVRGRLPGFAEHGSVCVITFFGTQDTVSRQALPRLDTLAQRYGKQVSVVGITDEPESVLREFVEKPEWGPKLGFVLAADPGRHAFRSFFGPRTVPSLPLSFVTKDGVIQWCGAPIDLPDVVSEVVAGRWDIPTAKRADAQRRAWDAALREVDSLASAGSAADALRKLDEACASAPAEQQAQCEGRRFAILVTARRVPEALAVGERILVKPANDKQPAGIAWTLLNAAPRDRDAVAFALRAAQQSDRALRSRDAMVGAILARAYFLADRRSDAVETARRALGFADSPDLQAALRDDIRNYEGSGPSVPASAPSPR